MKKLLFLVFPVLFFGCSTVQEVQQAVNCKYTLAGVEVQDASFTNVTLNVAMSVANQSKTTAASMNRFEGKFYINDNEVSNIGFDSYRVEPSSVGMVKTKLVLPFDAIGKNIAGLVIANSISLHYKLVGKIYFDTPLGQIPIPITVEPPAKKD